MENEQNYIANRKLITTRSSSCSSNSSSRHIANVANYKSEEGKMMASFKWIVSRVYGDSYVPDGLRSLFFQNNDGVLQPSPQLIASLTNGSLYGQAASRIFRDSVIASNTQHGIGSVFSALSREGIDVRDADGNAIVEEMLKQSNPFNTSAHLHMVDALMIAHLRSLVSIEKIVHAIGNYTSVEKREEPLDCVEALLFWINKICMLVRDDIEHNGLSDVDEVPTIPEMEDLYEDLCDGTCICALISFYQPDELPLREICFNDPMSVNDCRFNLGLLSKFCSSSLPWNPFHFETEDILYLHESLQPNINVFLADLFQFFEGHSSAVPPAEMAPTGQRRFVPIQPIPGLRVHDIIDYSQKGKCNTTSNPSNLQREAGIRDRASSLASEDSLATNTTLQTKDSLSASTPRPNILDPNAPNVTHFGALNKGVDGQSSSNGQKQQNQKQRPLKSTAEIRLQMEEIRRQLAQRQQMEMAKKEQRRCEAGKDAFFKVMSKSATIPPQFSSNAPPMGFPQQLAHPHHPPPLPPPHQHHYIPSPMPPPINNAAAQMFHQQQSNVPPIPPPFFPHQTPQLFAANAFHPPAEEPSTTSFRLHQANAPISRLDPNLDLNKDLTNWSQMTYRDGDRPQRKTWVQKQQTETCKSNPALNMPLSGNGGGPSAAEGRTMTMTDVRLSRDGSPVDNRPKDNNQFVLNQTYIKSQDDSVTLLLSPSSPVPAGAATGFANGAESANNRSGGVVLEDVVDPNSEMTPEMQAKRRAILASQIRRKERVMARSEEKETEERGRLQVKMQRIEQAQIRQVEREQRRQKLLEDYKRKKCEQELMMEPGSARTCASSTQSLARGQSQPPPFGRPKSQSNMNLANVGGGTLGKKAGRAQSNMGGNNSPKDHQQQNGDGSSTSRAVTIPASTAEPSLKLFAKQQPKSNRGLIMNALQYSVFPGHVSNEQRQKAQMAIAQSDSKHFLVLFRDQQFQYRGLYTWDQFSDAVHKIEGLGPKVCREPMMTTMFKYDSGAKTFGHIPTKHLSATIDGFAIADQFWQKPKIPHSGR